MGYRPAENEGKITGACVELIRANDPMKEFSTYFFLALSALLPLVNPPGTALELLSIVGAREARPYKVLARKMAVNMTLFLAAVAVAGPYILQFFGISIEVLQLVGGAVLAALGWQLLNQPDSKREIEDPAVRSAAEDCVTQWQTKAFYPLTFPVTVGPGSVAVTLTLSAQAKSLELASRIPAFVGIFTCVVLLAVAIYVCCAYAPFVTSRVPAGLVHGFLRIIAFLLICIGVEIAWHGLRTLVLASH
jgi:multiple antibiotic resistance protein